MNSKEVIYDGLNGRGEEKISCPNRGLCEISSITL